MGATWTYFLKNCACQLDLPFNKKNPHLRPILKDPSAKLNQQVTE